MTGPHSTEMTTAVKERTGRTVFVGIDIGIVVLPSDEVTKMGQGNLVRPSRWSVFMYRCELSNRETRRGVTRVSVGLFL